MFFKPFLPDQTITTLLCFNKLNKVNNHSSNITINMNSNNYNKVILFWTLIKTVNSKLF